MSDFSHADRTSKASEDPPWQSFGQWIEQGDYAPLIVERRLSGKQASLYRLRQEAGEYPDPATPDIPIQIVKSSTQGEVDLGSGKFKAIAAPNSACVAPAGTNCSYVISQPFELTVLPLPGALAYSVLDDVSQGRRTDHGIVHGRMQELPELAVLIDRLWIESEGADPMGELLVDDLLVAVSAVLARTACGLRPTAARPLQGARLQRTVEAINDRLDQRLTQADLAKVADMSPWHFCRSFQASMGVPPHRYVMMKRLASATRMLRDPTMALADIAVCCGFVDQAHLSKSFKMKVGTTPGRWRARFG